MKSLIRYIREHLKEDFNLKYYLIILVFLACTIFINYHFSFERKILKHTPTLLLKFLYYYLFYALPYYFTTFIYILIKKEKRFFKQKRYWIISSLFLILLSLDASITFYKVFNSFLPYFENQRYFIQKIGNQLFSVFTIILPLCLFYYVYDKKHQGFYGIRFKGYDFTIFFSVILIMLPIILIGSFHPSFYTFYPTYKTPLFIEYFNIKEWVLVIIYELSYGWDFIPTELVFRGIMVIGMSAILGRASIIPMVATYAFLHFGKPLGETISSIPGGFILGIIAYNKRNIIEGVSIHIFTAWTMEFFAYLQNHYLQ